MIYSNLPKEIKKEIMSFLQTPFITLRQCFKCNKKITIFKKDSYYLIQPYEYNDNKYKYYFCNHCRIKSLKYI